MGNTYHTDAFLYYALEDKRRRRVNDSRPLFMASFFHSLRPLKMHGSML